MKKVELLSPVGNMESLHQAVMNGADAVYLGGKKFGARKFANNFDSLELIEAIKYCHLYGVKIYVTVNTIIYENEFDEVLKYVEFLHENNVDAIIVQDLGLIRKVRALFPNMEVHASTQSHNHNSYGIKTLKDMGVTRVVLARELSLDEINSIKVDIEKEVFVHGALCVSYSGCCLFSSMNGGRSGNRGECVGSCRLPYKLFKNNEEIKTKGKYLLSTKSLCTLDKIGELIESGITSFKIEGRMKSPEYVGYVTRLYREKIDDYYNGKKVEVTETEITNLQKLYNREMTNGYLFNLSGKEIMNIKTSNHIGTPLGKVLKVDRKEIKILVSDVLNQEDAIRFDDGSGMIVNKLYNSKGLLVNKIDKKDIAIVDNKVGVKKASFVRKTIDSVLVKEIAKLRERKVEISIYCKAKANSLLELSFSDGVNKVSTTGNIVEKAATSPTSFERIKEQIEKLGGTPFKCIKTELDMDDNIFVPIKELNILRRELVTKLIEKREYYVPHPFEKGKFDLEEKSGDDKKLKIHVLVRNEEQLKCALNEKADSIYVDNFLLYKKYEKYSNIFYKTKRVMNDKSYLSMENKNILASELGAIEKYSKNNNVVSDYFLNVTNISSVSFLEKLGVKRVCLSVEANDDIVKSIAAIKKNVELMVYGRVELMVTKYCPLNMIINNDNKKCNLCDGKDEYYLVDQNDNKFRILNDKHLTHIMHYKNLNLINNIKRYKDFGISNFRLELSFEDEKEVKKIIEEIRNIYE